MAGAHASVASLALLLLALTTHSTPPRAQVACYCGGIPFSFTWAAGFALMVVIPVFLDGTAFSLAGGSLAVSEERVGV